MNQRSNPDAGILIVDDHQLTIDLVLDLLAGTFPGLPVRTAASAEEALVLCQAALPRVVIMDIGLPGASGIEAARRIKAMSSAVGVVMHSSYDQPIFREQCVAAGADAFVSKTHTFAKLVPAVARLWAQQPASPAGA